MFTDMSIMDIEYRILYIIPSFIISIGCTLFMYKKLSNIDTEYTSHSKMSFSVRVLYSCVIGGIIGLGWPVFLIAYLCRMI